jgi:hypothetical protein
VNDYNNFTRQRELKEELTVLGFRVAPMVVMAFDEFLQARIGAQVKNKVAEDLGVRKWWKPTKEVEKYIKTYLE